MDQESGISGWRLGIMVVALSASFFFSASEFAVIRLDRLKLAEEEEKGSRRAGILRRFLADTGRFLASISVGNTLANLLLSSFAAVTFAPPLARTLTRAFGLGADGAAESVATALITVLISFAVLVLGEIAPKQFAIGHGDAFARRFARPMRLWARITLPAVVLVNAGAKLVLRLFGVRVGRQEGADVSEEQILRQVEYGEEHGSIETDEKEMIENVFELNDLTAADVMVHRKDVVALPVDAEWGEVRDAIRRTGVSRIPVYRDTIDTIVGVLNSRDFLLRSLDAKTTAVAPLLRKPMFVPETVKADALLKRMQRRKQAMAIVIDDHGGTSGIVTMEDLVEQVVGEIYDEYDSDDDIVRIERVGDDRWRVPGEASIDDVYEALDTHLEEGEFVTLGGWLFERLSSVPSQGDVVEVPELGLRMRVDRMDGQRIDSVLVERTGPAPEVAPEAGD